MEKDEDKHDFDHVSSDDEEFDIDDGDDDTGVGGKKKKSVTAACVTKKATDTFLKLDPELKKVATTFVHPYGVNVDEGIVWTILGDSEAITEDPMDEHGSDDSDDDDVFKEEIDWHPDPSKVDYNYTFFEHFFPSVEGKAKVLDEYLNDERCPYYATVKNDGIRFHQEDERDPDFLVSQVFFPFYCHNYCVLG